MESPAAQPVAIHELSRRRRIGILLICSMSLLIVGIDVTIVNVALPSIGTDLHVGVSGLQWVVDAYTLVLASLLMLSGSTADRLGRRRTFVTGLVLFCLGSLACSLAPTPSVLIACRMLQAVGGSMLNPVAMSIITNTFTDPRERAQAVGIWGAMIGISMALGPVVGGLLVSSAGWRSIFWINIPVGIAAIALALRFIPESRAPYPRRFDPVGQVLMIILLATLTYSIIEGPGTGWVSFRILGGFLLAAGAAVAFVAYEPRRSEPLVDLRFFRSIPFACATGLAVAAFAALGGFLFLNTLYLQDVRGMSALTAGLATLPLAVMTVVMSPLSGRIVGTRGPRIPLLVSAIGVAVAAVMLVSLSATTPIPWLTASYAVFGLGFGLVNAPITNTAVSGMPRAQAGVAAAVASTSRQVGQTLGVAVVGAIVSAQVHGPLSASFAGASHAGWWLLVGCGCAILALGGLACSRWAQQSAHRVAVALNPENLAAPSRASA